MKRIEERAPRESADLPLNYFTLGWERNADILSGAVLRIVTEPVQFLGSGVRALGARGKPGDRAALARFAGPSLWTPGLDWEGLI